MSRLVRGDEVICRQCEMPWSGTVDPFTDDHSKENMNEFQLNLETLDISDEEHADDEDGRNTSVQPPLPQREKRRPGRKPNKPMTAQPSDNDEKELDIETLKRAQNEDDSLSFIINLKLKRNGQNKPSWNEISDKSPETKFWLARLQLLEIKEAL